jgi:hypothetical protein
MILLKNLLVSREPLYGIGEWAARHAPGAIHFFRLTQRSLL